MTAAAKRAHDKASRVRVVRETQAIDAAFAMVESVKGWGLNEWDDPDIQRAAKAAAQAFVTSLADRLPTDL